MPVSPRRKRQVGGIWQTASRALAMNPKRKGFCHCTGARAVHRLWNEFPEACFEAHAGKRLVFGGEA